MKHLHTTTLDGRDAVVHTINFINSAGEPVTYALRGNIGKRRTTQSWTIQGVEYLDGASIDNIVINNELRLVINHKIKEGFKS